jgi:hypothetical protein
MAIFAQSIQCQRKGKKKRESGTLFWANGGLKQDPISSGRQSRSWLSRRAESKREESERGQLMGCCFRFEGKERSRGVKGRRADADGRTGSRVGHAEFEGECKVVVKGGRGMCLERRVGNRRVEPPSRTL